jgi:hypothetical protein
MEATTATAAQANISPIPTTTTTILATVIMAGIQKDKIQEDNPAAENSVSFGGEMPLGEELLSRAAQEGGVEPYWVQWLESLGAEAWLPGVLSSSPSVPSSCDWRKAAAREREILRKTAVTLFKEAKGAPLSSGTAVVIRELLEVANAPSDIEVSRFLSLSCFLIYSVAFAMRGFL